MSTLARWTKLMGALGLENNEQTGGALLAAWSESHRHYHTTRHLTDCLARLDAVSSSAHDADEIELALWFHDAVYHPMRGGNEVASADRARRFLVEAGASPDRQRAVPALILATRHDAPAGDDDARLLVDIDLSILGAERSDYDRFESDVRREYRWVPWFLYRKRRREILQSFLDRPTIYATPQFRERHEANARENLRRVVQKLSPVP
jgi:predicted metal-dependent HD superfamily phosphohydrolase